jgi:hypothetical protein
VIRQQARHLLETKLTDELIAEHAEKIAKRAAAAKLPAKLAEKILRLLRAEPELSWDAALALLI